MGRCLWSNAIYAEHFLELAVDFDGDGRRDLVNNVPDALASTANFLDKRGYRTGEPWGYEVKLPSGFWAASNRKDKNLSATGATKASRLPMVAHCLLT